MVLVFKNILNICNPEVFIIFKADKEERDPRKNYVVIISFLTPYFALTFIGYY